MQDSSSKSIAVLPFANMSDRTDSEYFADGITEEIINALTRIPELRVTSRTSSFFYKGKNIPIPEIGKELGVTLILEGSVRYGGDKVRITAQLIHATDDFHFWSDTWDRDLSDIFQVQDEISLLIAEKSREFLGHFEISDHLVFKQTENITAYEYSLQAKYHKNKWSAEDIKLAEEYYLKGLDLDPNHIASMIGLSDVYSFMGMIGTMPFLEAWEKTNRLIDKTLELDPNHPEAYYQKSHSSFFTECNYTKACELVSKAIALKPNYVEAQLHLSFLHVLSGEIEKAKKHLDIGKKIDPLSQETWFFSAYFDYMTKNYACALNQLNRCLDVNPKNIPAHAVKTICLLKLGKYDEVIHYFDDLSIEMVEGEKNGAIGLAYAFKNDAENTQKYLDFLSNAAKSPDGFTSDSYLFMMHVVMGNYEAAFEWVKKGIKQKSTLLLLRYPDPIVENLISDKRYQEYHEVIFPKRVEEITESSRKALLDKKTSSEYLEKLHVHFGTNRPYLDSGLSLKVLAEQLAIHPNQLSWLINEKIGVSFNQFINAHRIEHFKSLALDPQHTQFSILGLAYESGFNSKTVFNTYFKKSTGQSPKAWIQAQ